MKWIGFVLLLGIAEIWTVGQLHPIFGTINLVGLYVVTTAIGALLLFLRLPEFRIAYQAMQRMEKKWKDRLRASKSQLNADDLLKVRPLLFVGVYFVAAVLVAIPGIVSDVIGVVVAIPIISNWYLDYTMSKAKRKFSRKRFVS